MRFQSVLRGDDDFICVESRIVAGSYNELRGLLHLASGKKLVLRHRHRKSTGRYPSRRAAGTAL